MAALATFEQLSARLPAATTVEESRAAALLVDATGAFRRKSRQLFEFVEDDEIVRPATLGVVRLPQRPVVEVTEVTDFDTDEDVAFLWLPGADTITVDPRRAVTITYSHGYEAIPDDVVAVICQMVARALGVDPTEAGTTQEAVVGYSVTTGSAAAAGAVGMLPEEDKLAKSYRRSGGSLRIA